MADMGFKEKSAEKQKAKDLKNELKKYKKRLCDAGFEKNTVGKYLKELQESLENAVRLQAEYASARDHMMRAHRKMGRMMDDMEEWTETEIIRQINLLVKELHLAANDCMLREDDTDFISSGNCLEKMAEGGVLAEPGMLIMLRSELENLYAVISDAFVWQAPDFFAFAYYLMHEDGASLKEMGNDLRNQFVSEYQDEHFYVPFFSACRKAGIEDAVRQTIWNYIYGTDQT